MTQWYERYLPFVARSLEKQVEWLESTLRVTLDSPEGVKTLSWDEIQPYVRLLLEDEGGERRQQLAGKLAALDEEVISQMLRAASIYDVISLFGLLGRPTVEQAKVALGKSAPPYDKSAQVVTDRLFLAVHHKAPSLMEDAVRLMRASGAQPTHFESAYRRFKEMLMDEEILSALFPKAKA
jgi:hypothetical protein